MGFSKSNKEPDVSIVVNYFGDTYELTFPKKLPQAALDAEQQFLGLKDDERGEKSREALVNLIAEMVTRPPKGFEDFSVVSGPSLADRMRAYFNDPKHPELEAILVGAWKGYKAVAVPTAYLKSPENRSAPGSRLSGATSKT